MNTRKLGLRFCLSGVIGAIAACGMLVVGSGPATAGQPVNTCTGLTIGSSTAYGTDSGYHVSGDSENVTPPATIAMTANVQDAGTPPHCPPSPTKDYTGNNVGFQWSVSSSLPVSCSSTTTAADIPVVNFTEGANYGATPTLTRHFITYDNTIPIDYSNKTIGFRAAYPGTASVDQTSYSPCIDVAIGPLEGNNPCTGIAPTAPLVLVLVGADGDGIVAEGSTGPWTAHYAFCAFEDVTFQSGQGGSSAWTAIASVVSKVVAASGNDDTNHCFLRKATGGGNEVWLCEYGKEVPKKNSNAQTSYTGGIKLQADDYVTVDVTVNGTVPNNIAMLPFTGQWSGLYCTVPDPNNWNTADCTNPIKTNYALNAYVQVTP